MAKQIIKDFVIECYDNTDNRYIFEHVIGYFNEGTKKLIIDLAESNIKEQINSSIKVLNATLELTVKETNLNDNFGGIYVYLGEKLVDVIKKPGDNGKIYINLTEEFRGVFVAEYGQLLLTLKTNDDEIDGYLTFYDSEVEEYKPKIILEYIPDNLKIENVACTEFNCMDASVGKVYLQDGSYEIEHTDLNIGSDFYPIPIRHEYSSIRYNKKGEEILDVKQIHDFNAGLGWKLNLQQYLYKNEQATSESGYEVYNYLDAKGNVHEFKEYYYYLLNDKKIYIEKNKVLINVDGSLTYNNYEVFKELKSTNGLTLVSDYSNFKTNDLVKLRSEDITNLENQLEELNNYVKSLEYTNEVLSKNKKLVNTSIEVRKQQTELEEYSINMSVEDLIYQKDLYQKQLNLQTLKNDLDCEYKQNIIEVINSYIKYIHDYYYHIISDFTEIERTKEDFENKYIYSVYNIVDYIIWKKVTEENNSDLGSYNVFSYVYNNSEELLDYNYEKIDEIIGYIKNNERYYECSYQKIYKDLYMNLYTDMTSYKKHVYDYYKIKRDDYILNSLYKDTNVINQDLFINERREYTKYSNLYSDYSYHISDYQLDHSIYEYLAHMYGDVYLENKNNEIEQLNLNQMNNINDKNEEYMNKRIDFNVINTEYNNLSEQNQLEQIEYEIDKNNKDIINYQIKIKQIKNSLNQLYAVTPIQYIVDLSQIVYGFNKYGNLILIADNKENQISLEYEKEKLVRLVENENKVMYFDYENGLLVKITNFFNEVVKFIYNDSKLVKIVNEDELITSFSYDEINRLVDIRNCFGYGYKIDVVNDKVVKLKEVTSAKSITDDGIEYYDEDVIREELTIDYINMHTTTITNKDNRVITYLLDANGVLNTVFEEINSETVSMTNDYVLNDCIVNSIVNTNSENLMDGVVWDSNENVEDGEYVIVKGGAFTENIAYTILDIEKVKNKKNLILSAYATADSAFIKTSKVNDYVDNDIDDEHLLNSDCFKQNRKFELRVETTYSNGTIKVTKASFDWMNQQKQYIAIPVSFIEGNSNNKTYLPSILPVVLYDDAVITEIKVIFDYSYNVNNLKFEAVQLREGEFTYVKLNENNLKTYEFSSKDSLEKYYTYDKNNLLIEEKSIKNNKSSTIKYKYNLNKQLLKVENSEGNVIENVYKNNRNIGSISYHTSNPLNKFYSIKEYDENNKLKKVYDQRGICHSEYEYFDESSPFVKSILQANGTRLYQGYDNKNGNLISIMSIVDNSINSNEINYTKGLITKQTSNNTSYTYEYDGFARLIKMSINDIVQFIKEYFDDEKQEVVKYLNGEGYRIIYDIYGKIIAINYINSLNEESNFVENEYNDEQLLAKSLEFENGVCYNQTEYEYDNYNNLIKSVVYENDEEIIFENKYNSKKQLTNTSITMNGIERNYYYSYDDSFKERLHTICLPNTLTQTIEYDKLGRVVRVNFDNGMVKEYQYMQNDDHATSLISSIIIKFNNQIIKKQMYIYDINENITEIRENGIIINRYLYDGINRLIREDNRHLGFSKIYEYDCNGNITLVNIGNFTLSNEIDDLTKLVINEYEIAGWNDQLIKHNEYEITYDELGNPQQFKNQLITYDKCRRIKSIGDVEYTYNTSGIRTSKIYNDKVTKYVISNGRIISEKNINTNEEIYYYYGSEGLIGFNYNGNEYLYLKNLLNDITHIVDLDGNIVAKYEYDAWGTHVVFDETGAENTDPTFIGNINPFRYREYYYDIETQLFYCNSRYYSPELCRWISPDSIEYLDPESINGLNLYCYCYNNPISYADPSGNLPFFILTAIIGAVIGVGITAAVDYIPDKEFDLHWGWYVGAGVLGAAIGAGIGMAVSYYATGSIASSTGQVFTSLFKSTSLYRSVGPDELADLKATGKFRQGPNSMEGKFFANSKKGAMKWGKSFNQSSYVKIRVPKSSLSNSSVNAMKYLDAIDDAFYFSDLGYLNSIAGKIWFL